MSKFIAANSKRRPRFATLEKHAAIACLSTVFLFLAGNAYGEAFSADEVVQRIGQLRTIQASEDPATNLRSTRVMDDNYRYFRANRTSSLPILRRELAAELLSPTPNNLILLDIGYLVISDDDPQNRAVGRDALFKLDPASPLVQANYKELFEFCHVAARARVPGLLEILDRVFLTTKRQIVIPERVVLLDGSMTSAFLYGAYGPESEIHLADMLHNSATRSRILEILIWIGSDKSIPQVKRALEESPDFDTLTRTVSFMMKNGGPEGRAFLLSLDPTRFDSQGQAYLEKIHKGVEGASFEAYRSMVSTTPIGDKVSDTELQDRLAEMNKTGKFDQLTTPRAILDSTLTTEYLSGELINIRARMFYAVSNQALTNVTMANLLLNTLRFRPA